MSGPNPLDRLPPLVFGTQYYRQPTPLPAEWDKDLANIKRLGLDVIQLRPQWRWHERNEGELNFDDLDRLFDLAAKHGLGVIFKFFLSCGPQWLFDNYDAMRVRPDGTAMIPFSHGAMYIGGFAPCFDKPLVREKASRFIRAAVRRYKGRDNLLAWHAWNEPRSRPATDCACKDSLRLWREWLKERFGTIERLNEFAGLAVSGKGDDFSGVHPPVAASDHTGWLLFRPFRAVMVADRLRWVYDEIRRIDKSRPIISHVGFSSVVQDPLEDTSNDYLNAQSVDLYGASCPNTKANLPLLGTQPVAYEAATAELICSRLRGVSDPFWINEVYANPSGWAGGRKPSYLRQTSYHVLAAGARGILYWQYRSERLTTESNGSGIVEVDGSATDRSTEVARMGKFLKAHRDEIAAARPPRASVAIPYDYQNDLVSRLETAKEGTLESYPYKDSLRGIHLALWQLDAPVDIIPSEQFERLLDYRAVYLPCPRCLSPEHVDLLGKFVKAGGLLICEPSPGMRDANGWVSPEVPPKALAGLFGCRQVSRRRTDGPVTLDAGAARIGCPAGLFVTTLAMTNRRGRVEVAGAWPGGEPAIVSRAYGRGRAILLGAPLGQVYFHTRDKGAAKWLAATLEASGIAIERLLAAPPADLHARRLVADDGEVIFVFNYADRPARAAIRARGMKDIRELTDLNVTFTRRGGSFVAQIPAEEVLVVKLGR